MKARLWENRKQGLDRVMYLRLPEILSFVAFKNVQTYI